MWGDLLIGLQEALTWQNMGLMFLGTVWGFIGGALPGIQASTAMALILPITWGMSPSGALMMLAAVYVSAEYSHSIPAILIRTPGTSAAVVTTFDGYPLQQQGKGGKALSVSPVRRLHRSNHRHRIVDRAGVAAVDPGRCPSALPSSLRWGYSVSLS